MSFERTIQMENHIILPVFGQFDANIKKIEKACGVSIVNRGDDVKISGEEKDVHKAWNILHSLVALVKKGEEITEQNISFPPRRKPTCVNWKKCMMISSALP